MLFFMFEKYFNLMISLFTMLLYYVYTSKHTTFSENDIIIHKTNALFPRFPIFFSGSFMAYAYFKYEKCNNKLLHFVTKNIITQFLLSILTFFMFVYYIKRYTPFFTPTISYYKDSIRPGVYFAVLLFLILISEPNFFIKLFSENYFFTESGKYSFGIYLFHPLILLLKFVFIEHKITYSQNEIVFATILLSKLAGFIFYYAIENPCMKIGNIFITSLIATHSDSSQMTKSENIA